MIQIYKTKEGVSYELDKREEGCWIMMTDPTEQELRNIAQEYDIELGDIRAAMDEEERARLQIEDHYSMIIVDVPAIDVREDREYYMTIPMSVLLVKDAIITVCIEENVVLKSFLNSNVRHFHTRMKTRFVLQLLYKNAQCYLHYLRIINRKSEEVEDKLYKSTQNRDLLELMELEKSLVYFTASLRSNEVVLEKLMLAESIKKYPEDTDLLEDVIIENKQALEMVNIYNGILGNMVETFASIISNNLNVVMKFLATITIVLSIPTMIFSAYGMNVNITGMPFAQNVAGFVIVIVLSVVISVLVAVVFAKKNLF